MINLDDFTDKVNTFQKLRNSIDLQLVVMQSLFKEWGLEAPHRINNLLDERFTIDGCAAIIHNSEGDYTVVMGGFTFRDNVMILFENDCWYLLRKENEVNGLFKS